MLHKRLVQWHNNGGYWNIQKSVFYLIYFFQLTRAEDPLSDWQPKQGWDLYWAGEHGFAVLLVLKTLSAARLNIAMPRNIKNSERNKIEQRESARRVQQWGWFVKMSLSAEITNSAHQCHKNVQVLA